MSETTSAQFHTPGPWKAVMQFGAWHVRQDPEAWDGMGYQHIASLPSDRKGTHYGDMFKANARLIAAAPELLKALQEAEDFITSYFGPVTSDTPDAWSDNDAREVALQARVAITL
jgi:hypothetical protein